MTKFSPAWSHGHVRQNLRLSLSHCRSNFPLSFSPDDCSDEITFPYGEYYSSMPSVLSSYYPPPAYDHVCVWGLEPVGEWETRVGHVCACMSAVMSVSEMGSEFKCMSIGASNSQSEHHCQDKTQCNNLHQELIVIAVALRLCECFHDSCHCLKNTIIILCTHPRQGRCIF